LGHSRVDCRSDDVANLLTENDVSHSTKAPCVTFIALGAPDLNGHSAQPDQLNMPKKIVSKVAQADSRADARQPDILQTRPVHPRGYRAAAGSEF